MDPQWRALVPPQVRRLPADLAATIALTLATVAVVVLPVVRETPLRIALGLPFVLFLPGYAFVAALFPEAGEGPVAADPGVATDDGTGHATTDDGPGSAGTDTDETAPDETARDDATASSTPDSDASRFTPAAVADRGIDGIERVALSFGLSIAIVPLLGLALNFTPWGIRLAPILVAVGGFTLGCAVIATWRRLALPPAERFRVPFRAWYASARSELLEPADRTDAALNVLLVASLVLAVGSVGYAIAVPPDGERFSELYLLTEDEEDELVAADYPEELVVGEPAPLVVGVGNSEHERTNYTVVVQLQAVEFETEERVLEDDPRGNGTNVTGVSVLESRELARFRTALAHDETWHHDHEVVAPEMVGENRRLQYLLYRGEPPETVNRSTAYRDVHLWVDVADPDAG